MKEFLDFDKNHQHHIRIFYYAISLLGIYGNIVDLIINPQDWNNLLNWFNVAVIAIIITGTAFLILKYITLKTAFTFTIYSLLINIILSNYLTLQIKPDSYIYLLREALYVCFLITAAYLFVNEFHGFLTGTIFTIYFIIASLLIKNTFISNNLPGIVVLYLSYILILNYFYRYLNFTINKLNDDSRIIKFQNEKLKKTNQELNDYQQHVTAQNEEVITLSESLAQQNKVLEEQNLKLEEALQQKGKIFSIIAHDIKSPLYSMSSLMELMLEKFDDLTEERKKVFITKMLGSNKLLQNLIENLLAWSRTQTGMLEISTEKIDINSTVGKIIALYKSFASNKSLQLIYDIEKDLFVYADRMMFETILRNLISNAIKYSFEHGMVSIKAEKQGIYIKFEIRDSGMGIEKNRIGTLFSYADNITTLGTKGEKGTGLGLRICKEFIEKLNGKIWLESEPNKGTTIHFILPHLDT